MKKLLLPCIIAATFSAQANEQQLPHTFQANTPAKAAEVNENFNYLLQAITTTQDDTQAQVNTLNGTLVQLTQDIEQQNQTLTSAGNTLTTHGTNINALQALTTAQSEQLTELQTRTANHTVYYGELASALAAQSNSLDTLSNQLNSVQSSLTSANSQLNSVQGTVGNHSELLTVQGTSIANNANSITQLNTQLGDLNTQIATAANQVTINTGQISQLSLETATQRAVLTDIANTTTSHSSTLTALTTEQSALSAKQQKLDQDLGALDTSVMDLSNAVNSNTSAVASMQTSVNSVQGSVTQQESRLSELESERVKKYITPKDVHNHDAEFVYNYRPTTPGQQISLQGHTYRMYRLPIIDMETGQKYAVDIPMAEHSIYRSQRWSTSHQCSTFMYNPSVEVGAGALAVFSPERRDQREYWLSSDKFSTEYEGELLGPTVHIRIGEATCTTFYMPRTKDIEEGETTVQSDDYDLTDNIDWVNKGDRLDEFPDLSELLHYIRVVAL
ncbi:hypothetical protein [Pseudoalteromonas rubra]|uniref:hypothetical protein n=1 Tax=Pseudoalteromonas rubra TaxID=43658 RepID=UPI000F777E96|nr:hypothetical protein [Pseudoalteromonas rubra]